MNTFWRDKIWRAALATILTCCAMRSATAGEILFRVQEISDRLTIGYATRLVDVNGDGKLDIVVVDTARVIWFENPNWMLHSMIEGQTKQDNVSIAPYDIDGD